MSHPRYATGRSLLPETGRLEVRQALRMTTFRRLLAAYGLNELTWSFGTITLAVLVYRRTGSALGSTAFFLCSQFAPALASPLLVARLTGVNYRRILPALYALEAAAVRGAGVDGHALLAGADARGDADRRHRRAQRPGPGAHGDRRCAAAPRPAARGQRLINLVFSVCFMVGPAIGGLVVAAGRDGRLAAGQLRPVRGHRADAGDHGAACRADRTRRTGSRPARQRLRAAIAHARGDRRSAGC